MNNVETQANLIDVLTLKTIEEEYQKNIDKKTDCLGLGDYENPVQSNMIDSALIYKPEPMDIFNISIIKKKS